MIWKILYLMSTLKVFGYHKLSIDIDYLNFKPKSSTFSKI